MRPSLVRTFVAYPVSLVQQSLRGRPVLVKHVDVASRTGRRRLSGTADRGQGEEDYSKDITDLNAEIEGFVGDLGDPDFDTAPSGSRRDARDASSNLRGNNIQPGGTPAGSPAMRSINASQPRPRLTQADHPLAARLPGLDAEPQQPDWLSSLVPEHRLDGNRTRVLVLNGAACFIAGKLASTGEPRVDITKSMEAAAEEYNLSLTICTSNREEELLDKLCEGEYDAIVYNPSGFRFRDAGGFAEVSNTSPVLTAIDADALVQAEGDEGALRGRQPTRRDSRQHGVRGDVFEKHGGSGRLIEYGLAHARCPVVTVSPRDDAAPETRALGQLGRGAISGFSGAVSYRLAMMAVASVLKDHR